MKQRDKHIKDILFSKMFLFAGSEDSFVTAARAGQLERIQNTSTPESKGTGESSSETASTAAKTGDSVSTSNTPSQAPESSTAATPATSVEATPTPQQSKSNISAPARGVVKTDIKINPGQNKNSGTLESPADPNANVPGLHFSPTYSKWPETKPGVKSDPNIAKYIKPVSTEALLESNGGNVSGIETSTAASPEGPSFTSTPASTPTKAPAPVQKAPVQAKNQFLDDKGHVKNEEYNKFGKEKYEPGFKKYVDERFEEWSKGDGANASNEEKLNKKKALEAEYNARPENAQYLAIKHSRNTTGNIALGMLPREGETWAQAYKRWTPEQKAAAWGGLGIGGLFSIGLMSKKKKDMLDYGLAVATPFLGVAAGAGGASMYHSDPNTIDAGRYQHYYNQYANPTQKA